jgi:hypothetical protein
MENEPHQPSCARDLYAAYEATYESLRDEPNRGAVLEAARSSRRCPRVRADCALVQALFDVNRRIPKRSRANFFSTMQSVVEGCEQDADEPIPRPR